MSFFKDIWQVLKPAEYQHRINEEISDLLETDRNKINFLKGYVLDVISNPLEWLNADSMFSNNSKDKPKNKDIFIKRNENEDTNLTGSSNFWLANFMPANSILCFVSERGEHGVEPIIAFPFYPAHLSFPCKAGEMVWLLKEESQGADTYYWLHRITTFKQIDDVNYTCIDRISDVNDAISKNSTEVSY